MSVLMAEGWKTYADRTEIQFGYPLHASVGSNTAFADVSGRRTCDLAGGRVSRGVTASRRVGAVFIVDLTAGSIGTNMTLFSFGLNPVNIVSSAYTFNSNERFQVEAFGPNIRVYRRAFNPDGTTASTVQTVATVAHGMTAGTSYRIEILADVTSETGRVEVLINGVSVVASDFSRTIGTYACDASFGIVTLYCQNSSGCRGRLSNVVVYSDDAVTSWPVGPLNIGYLPAQPNGGETMNFPPLASDPEIPVTDESGKTWQLGDISGVSAASIKAVIGSVRMSSPDAVVPASADVVLRNGSAVLASSTQIVQPGTPVYDRHTIIPVTDPAVLNAMTMTIRKTP